MATEINSEIDASKFQAAADKSEILMCVCNQSASHNIRPFLDATVITRVKLKKKYINALIFIYHKTDY